MTHEFETLARMPVVVMRCARVVGFPAVAARCDSLETALAYLRTAEARIYRAHDYVQWIEGRSYRRGEMVVDRRAWVRCGGPRGCGSALRRTATRCTNAYCAQPRDGWTVVSDTVAAMRRALGV